LRDFDLTLFDGYLVVVGLHEFLLYDTDVDRSNLLLEVVHVIVRLDRSLLAELLVLQTQLHDEWLQVEPVQFAQLGLVAFHEGVH